MALDCKKLVGITEKAQSRSLAKVKEWLVGRQQAIAEDMVVRAEAGYGHSVVNVPAKQILGLTPNKDNIGTIVTVCKKAVADFVGEEAKVSASAHYDNVLVTITWKELG